MADALSLTRAADEARAAAAIVSPEETITYADLHARCLAMKESPRVLRVAVGIPTLETIHTAFLGHRWFAPIHPAAPPDTESRLSDRLATLSMARSAAVLISTSGTTGTPKLVEISREALAAHARAANAHLAVKSDDRWLLALPLAHMGGLAIAARCLAARAAVVLAPPPPLGHGFGAWLVETTDAHAITRWSLVPAQLRQLLVERQSVPPSLRSVLMGGQSVPPSLLRSALAAGWPIVVSYGLTETCGMCVASRPGEDAGHSAGRALDGVALRVVNEQLEIRGAMLASRVHGASDALGDDGWLRTADRARLGQDGALFVLGRADDVIISAGHKIDPLEVEAALRSAPRVLDAVVVGVADERFGSRVVALIVAEGDDGEATSAGILAALDGALPRYKHPRELHFTETLPLLPSGKIDRTAAAARCAVTRARPR